MERLVIKLRFNNTVIWMASLLGIVFFGLLIYLFFLSELNWGVLIGIFFLILLGFIQFSSRSILELNSNEIRYKYIPFIWKMKSIKIEDIESVTFKTNLTFLEYGGVGLRKTGKGWAYILGHENSTEILTKSGHEVVFDCPEELFQKLERHFEKYIPNKISTNTKEKTNN